MLERQRETSTLRNKNRFLSTLSIGIYLIFNSTVEISWFQVLPDYEVTAGREQEGRRGNKRNLKLLRSIIYTVSRL